MKPSSPSYRILVVDDDPSVRTAYRMTLKHYGHHVQTVEDGMAAMKLFETKQFDLVITDYAMADMKGDELAVRIKSRKPDQPVIMVTAFAESVLASGRAIDVDCILGKPFRVQELQAAILNVMAHTRSAP